jgi:casein kinase II subunit beta
MKDRLKGLKIETGFEEEDEELDDDDDDEEDEEMEGGERFQGAAVPRE